MRSVEVGKAVVRMKGHVLRVARAGDDRLDLIRAASTAVYASGLQIYGIDVDPELLALL